ncbi:3-phosphoglycerate dehydrogenase, partial [Bifidobacterium longum]|nr:3-phosphoglycerate dehydrogenase [Bifidobacterium longum]
ANDAQRLGMKVIGYDPYLSIEHAWNLSHHVKRVNDLAEIFERADYITVHTPATDETREMLNLKNLSKCIKGVILLNYARDEIT